MKTVLNITGGAVVSVTIGSETSTLPTPINKVAFIAGMPKPFIRVQGTGDVDGTTETYENFKLGVSSVVTPGDFQASQAAQDVKIAQLQAQGKFRGSFPTTAARDAAITSPAQGDYVTIGTASPYQITIYQGTAWINGGTTTGPFDFTVIDLTAATSEDAIFTSAIVGKWYTIKTQEGSVRLVQCYNKVPTYAEFWGEGYAQIVDFSATQGVNTLPVAKYSNVVVSQTPTDPGHAAAKKYVDDKFAAIPTDDVTWRNKKVNNGTATINFQDVDPSDPLVTANYVAPALNSLPGLTSLLNRKFGKVSQVNLSTLDGSADNKTGMLVSDFYDGVRITTGTVGAALTQINTAIGKGYNVTLVTPTNNRTLFVDGGVPYVGIVTSIVAVGLAVIATNQTATALSATTYVLIGKEK